MSKVLTIDNGDPWLVGSKTVYKASGVSADVGAGTATTALFNVCADGISAGVPYKTSAGRNYPVTDIYGNTYSGASAASCKYVLAVNNMHCVMAPPKEPLPPVELPAYTFRFQFSDTAYNPTNVTGWKSGSTWTQVEDAETNQWDYTHVTANWDDEFRGKFSAANNLVDILYAGEFSGVTSMGNIHGANAKVAGGTFGSKDAGTQSYLRSICSFNTENVKNMEGMFFHCAQLTTAPALNTSACSSFWSMFDTCGSLKWINGLDFTNAVHIRALAANCSLRILPDLSTIDQTKIVSAGYIFQGNYMCGEFGSPGISASYYYLSGCTNSKFNHGSAYSKTASATSATIPQVAAELALIPNSWK